MKNILLIGDSILVGSNQTSGYGTIVRDMLKDMSIRKRVGLRSTPVCGKICVWIYFW